MFRKIAFASFPGSVLASVFSLSFASDVDAGVGTREVTLPPSVTAKTARTANQGLKYCCVLRRPGVS